MTSIRARLPVVLLVPVLLTAAAGCDIVTAEFNSKETSEWRKTYELQPGGRVEVSNVNGKIEVQPSTGNAVEVVAFKTGRGSSQEAARQALGRIEIVDESSPSAVRIHTKVPRGSGFMHGSADVRYTVRVPAAAEVRFTTINGGIEIEGLKGRIAAETTNGGVRARGVAGPIEAATTNGGVEVELTDVAQGGVKLECTNGGISLRLPADAKATISANVTNGGINAGGLPLETTESTRRRLEGRLNGGGPLVRLAGTNGGIRIAAR